MRTRGGRRTALALAAAALGVFAVACAGDRDRVGERDGTVIVAYPGDERGLSPAWDDAPRRLVFQHMVSYEELWCGRPLGGLAQQWVHSDDYRHWTIRLRNDNRWHDGVPFTAHDIRFTIELWNHPDVNYWYGRDVDSVVVVDDHTLHLYHRRASAMALDSWIVYYPRHLLEHLDPADFYDWDFWIRPVGNGAFRYVRHVPKTMMEFEANPDYYRGRPRIDRVILRFGEASLVDLLSGRVDILQGVSPLTALKVAGDPRFRIYHERMPAPRHIVWNLRHPHLSDARVRRALTQAIDRRALHAVLGYPDDLPITDGVYTPCQFVEGEIPPAWPHDPAAARRLLADAGWHDTGRGDHTRRAQEELRFTLLVASDLDEQAAVFIQDQYRRIGVGMAIQRVDRTVLRTRIRNGDFDAVMDARPGPGQPAEYLGEQAPGGYRNPEVAALLARGTETVNPDTLATLYRQLSSFLHDDLPVTFLAPSVGTHIVRADIRGLSDWRGPLSFLEHAWIEPPE